MAITLTDDELDRALLFHMRMHKGKANAVSRWALVEQLFGPDAAAERTDGNSYDRALRRGVERLRRQGHIVCNLGEGSGYFLATSPEEYQAFRASYGAHAFPVLETIREMDKSAEELWPNPLQPRML